MLRPAILIGNCMRAPLWQIVAAFASVYLIWGSTYLAIRFAVESLPVFSYAGVRFVVAGAILYAIVRLRGGPRPTREHWRDAAIVGALLLLVGNGGVSLAERSVPSGIAAVIISASPFWMTGIEALLPDGERISRRAW